MSVSFTLRIVVGFLIAFTSCWLAPDALSREAPWRIGWLDPQRPPTAERPNGNLTTFEKAMADLGYTQGRDFVIEARFADLRYEQLPALATELIERGVDIIVTIGTPPVSAAKAATATIPIVMAGSSDPVGRGLIASLAHPSGNITGVTNNPGPEFNGKALQLLKEMAPSISRIAIIWDSLAPGERLFADAQNLHLTLLPHNVREVKNADDFDAVLSAIKGEGADALVVSPDFVVSGYYSRIVRFAEENRLPSLFQDIWPVENGGLLFYYTNWFDLRRRAAAYVDKIIKGAAPGDLPVEQPTKFELVINLKTAKALGLTVPQSILINADRMIE